MPPNSYHASKLAVLQYRTQPLMRFGTAPPASATKESDQMPIQTMHDPRRRRCSLTSLIYVLVLLVVAILSRVPSFSFSMPLWCPPVLVVHVVRLLLLWAPFAAFFAPFPATGAGASLGLLHCLLDLRGRWLPASPNGCRTSDGEQVSRASRCPWCTRVLIVTGSVATTCTSLRRPKLLQSCSTPLHHQRLLQGLGPRCIRGFDERPAGLGLHPVELHTQLIGFGHGFTSRKRL